MSSLRNEFDKIEHRLRDLFEGGLAQTPSKSQLEMELFDRLENALWEGVEVGQDGVQWAPDFYQIDLSHQLSLVLEEDQNICARLSEQLLNLCKQRNLPVHTPIRTRISSDPSLHKEQFSVKGYITSTDIQETSAFTSEKLSDNRTIPINAYLIVGGNRVFQLDQPVINIGRRPDNHLVIDDPRVSRVHAQLRVIREHYNIIDLNSTGGTYVNGIRKMQTILFPGDIISLAGYSLVYGQDGITVQGDQQGYTEPFSPDTSLK